MTMHIRRYQDCDREQVLHLHKVALAGVGADAGPGPWDDDLAQIEQAYLTARGDFLVGILDDRVAAMGALRQVDEHIVELKRMRVSPELQGQGLGRRLLRALEGRARELGYTRIVLDTTERQAAAIALYQHEGYLETGQGELAGLPTLFFRKTLAAATIESAPADAVNDKPGTAISG